jgi:replicative DNA helicase
MGDRVAPYSEEAERAVIGAAMLDWMRVMPLVQQMRVKPQDFYMVAHQTIMEEIQALFTEMKGVDSVVLTERLRRKKLEEQAGGSGYIDRLIDTTPTVAHAEYYLDIVRQKALLRRVATAAKDIEAECWTEERGDKVLGTATARFSGLAESVLLEESTNEQLLNLSVKAWVDARAHKQPDIGLETPWPTLTEMICGLETGITILAGRPSQGKTTIEDMMVCHCAATGTPVGRITLDSTRKSLLQRAVCREAGVSLPKLKYGFAGEANMAQVTEAAGRLAKYPMWINDWERDIAGICAWTRAMKIRYGIKLLTVDYIQIVQAAMMGRAQWDANSRMTYVSSQLKTLAFELDMPVLVLSQLSREADKEQRRPRLSDLRDSGSIEQDANKVLFVSKDVKEAKEKETKQRRPMWLDVAKNKDGEIGELPMWMRPNYFRFDEADENFTDNPGASVAPGVTAWTPEEEEGDET